MTSSDWEQARGLLCRLGREIRCAVYEAQQATDRENLSLVAEVTEADTLYQIDKVSDATVLGWLGANWPRDWPLQLVMEGIPDARPVTFPSNVPLDHTKLVLIVDPIDGTRALMYDKRSAWSLAALATRRGGTTNLSHLQVAVMTELPTSKQWRADQISGVRGSGAVVAESANVREPEAASTPLLLRPSTASDFRHGFASFVKFFPEGKALTAQIEEALWDQMYGRERRTTPLVFDDQYLSTAGQIYELLTGHDRMVADLRPLVLPMLGYGGMTMCHPYDICTGFLLQEAGGVLESPDGSALASPLDTTTPVAWIGYANRTLADLARPILRQLCHNFLGARTR